ncbi:MAG: DNA alkylation repair protein [Acidobacteriia bacterium]|nr:DNA alkylation repair protein [Terriglobia bacterium]
MDYAEIMKILESHANPAAVEGMARFGIEAKRVYGVPTPVLRKLARQIGKNHELASKLWATEILDARGLATLVDDPKCVTKRQMELWVRDFDSWAVCDAACLNLFRWTPWAYDKCREWSRRRAEFEKRAAFSLLAGLAVSDKAAKDEAFRVFFPIIEREAVDERNFVKKAVNWALRQIGKRNRRLNREAVRIAEGMRRLDSSSARWIAADALRELKGSAVQRRLKS